MPAAECGKVMLPRDILYKLQGHWKSRATYVILTDGIISSAIIQVRKCSKQWPC